MRIPATLALTVAALRVAFAGISATAADRTDQTLTTQVGPVEVQIFIPRQAQPVRGLIVHAANYKLSNEDRWAELCRQLRFVHVAMNIPNVQKATNRVQKLTQALDDGLKEFAEQSGHAELTTVPRAGTGHSAGGLVTKVLLKEPARTLTYCVDCGWVVDSTELTPEAARVPALFTLGAVPDAFKMLPAIEQHYVPARKAGLPWGLGVQWECAHDFGNAAALMFPWIRAVTAQRLPAERAGATGAPTLVDLKPETGWLGDRSTIDSSYAVIAPWNEYAGDKSQATWFPNRAVACVWRAWQARGNAVTLEAVTTDGAQKLPPWQPKKSRDLMLDPNMNLVLTATIKPGFTVKKVVYFDSDQELGTGAAAADWRWDWNAPSPGMHVVHAQWETADGKLGVSNPALVIVRTK